MTNEKTNIKIVVIGGSGLIGSRVVSKLGERGYHGRALRSNMGIRDLEQNAHPLSSGWAGAGIINSSGRGATANTMGGFSQTISPSVATFTGRCRRRCAGRSCPQLPSPTSSSPPTFRSEAREAATRA